jgi:hypothetical protein
MGPHKFFLIKARQVFQASKKHAHSVNVNGHRATAALLPLAAAGSAAPPACSGQRREPEGGKGNAGGSRSI